jgi:hypothetical protein
VRAVEDPHLAKQDNRNTAAFTLTDVPAKLLEERDEVSPRDTAADRPDEDQIERALVPALHPMMVLHPSTAMVVA